MTAPHLDLNHLRRGATYRAVTCCGVAVGEYLGMETPHGNRSILLRHPTGTDSVSISAIASIQLAA